MTENVSLLKIGAELMLQCFSGSDLRLPVHHHESRFMIQAKIEKLLRDIEQNSKNADHFSL